MNVILISIFKKSPSVQFHFITADIDFITEPKHDKMTFAPSAV